MNEWSEHLLGEICSIEIGGTPSRSNPCYWWQLNNKEKPLPWVSISDMKQKVITQTKESITRLGAQRSNCKLIAKGTLLMSFKLSIGRLAIAGTDLYTNEAIAALKPVKKVDLDFLYYGLQYWNLTSDSDQAVKGVTLNKQKLKAIICLLPPLPEQKTIVKILTYFDKLINQLEKQKSTQRNIFIALISDLFLSEDNSISKVKIGEICNVKRGASPRPIQSKKWWGKGRGWTRITDVTKSNKYLYKTKDHLSPEGEQKSVAIDSGDLILSICATIGLPIIVKTPICIHDGFVWFEGLKDSLEVEYAYYFFSAIRNQLLQGSQTGTQGNLNTSIVSNIEIPLRSFDEQKRISTILSSLDNNISFTSKKIDKYKNLKRSLINNLLSGSKRVKV